MASEVDRWWGRPLAEMRWQAELTRLCLDPMFLRGTEPRGDGRPVVLVPGFAGGDWTLQHLAFWLRRSGYDAARCNFLVNAGCAAKALARVERRVIECSERSGRRVAVLGHSAGGYLAETLATHPRVDLVVPLAGALDLAGVVRAGWDGGAVAEWLGAGPDQEPDRYAATDLLPRLPTGTTRVLIHGSADATVGVEQSRAFAAAAAAAGDLTDLIELEGEGHYAFLDPRQPAFETLCSVLERWRTVVFE